MIVEDLTLSASFQSFAHEYSKDILSGHEGLTGLINSCYFFTSANKSKT